VAGSPSVDVEIVRAVDDVDTATSGKWAPTNPLIRMARLCVRKGWFASEVTPTSPLMFLPADIGDGDFRPVRPSVAIAALALLSMMLVGAAEKPTAGDSGPAQMPRPMDRTIGCLDPTAYGRTVDWSGVATGEPPHRHGRLAGVTKPRR
jgi:hypothetical protein